MSQPAVIQQNLLFLNQGRDLLQLVDDQVYTAAPEDRPRAAGIGPHLRHCLDFYLCFLRDLESGRIDYDRRDRDSPVELDRSSALETIDRISKQIQSIEARHIERPIEVLHDRAPSEEGSSCWHPSTVGRELRFLVSHTVHHYALMALILRMQGVEPRDAFGVAPATLAHWESEVESARST